MSSPRIRLIAESDAELDIKQTVSSVDVSTMSPRSKPSTFSGRPLRLWHFTSGRRQRILLVVLLILISIIIYFSQVHIRRSRYIVNTDSPDSVMSVYRYQPTWESLSKRPIPPWYDEAKFGIFIHWGVFSVPSFGNEWFWQYWKGYNKVKYVDFMKKNYLPKFDYPDFVDQFTAEFFNPDQWADLFKRSGARYIVFTSKHHEGFTNWNSRYSFNWNSVSSGPHRDLVADLANSIRNRTNLRFGLYHSLFEWFHPLYRSDKAHNYSSQEFVKAKTIPELYELVNTFKPEIVWSDGDWMTSYTYWNSPEFLAWLYSQSPVRDTVVTNDRWGNESWCTYGDFFTCRDRYNPGMLQAHKWENCLTIDNRSWGFRREAPLKDYLTIHDLITVLAETVSCGGNMLLNVGPSHDGRIVPIYQERLLQMGDWLKVNGEAIYGTKPWKYQNDTSTSGVWYTSKKSLKGTDVYAIVLNWPEGNSLALGVPSPTSKTTVHMLGLEKPFQWENQPAGDMIIKFPIVDLDELPSQTAWVLKLTDLE